jgi:hypothetical protein
LMEGTPIDLEKEASDDEEEEESDEDEDDDEEDSSEDEDGEGAAEGEVVKLTEIEQLRRDIDPKDPLNPRAEETLRSYFSRTAGQWATIALEESRGVASSGGGGGGDVSGGGGLSQEQLKDYALKLASGHYSDMLPSVLRLVELEKHEKAEAENVKKSKPKSSSKSSSKSDKKKSGGGRDPVGMVVRV